jgi:hypothetical protein
VWLTYLIAETTDIIRKGKLKWKLGRKIENTVTFIHSQPRDSVMRFCELGKEQVISNAVSQREKLVHRIARTIALHQATRVEFHASFSFHTFIILMLPTLCYGVSCEADCGVN